MKKLHLSAGKNKSMVLCVGVGLLTALVISVALTLGLTSLVQNGTLSENGSLGVFLIRVIATFIGGLLGAGLADKRFLPVIGTIWAGYLLVLLGTGVILFDGTFHQFWQGVLSTAIGAAIALLIKLKPQSKSKKTIRYTK